MEAPESRPLRFSRLPQGILNGSFLCRAGDCLCGARSCRVRFQRPRELMEPLLGPPAVQPCRPTARLLHGIELLDEPRGEDARAKGLFLQWRIRSGTRLSRFATWKSCAISGSGSSLTAPRSRSTMTLGFFRPTARISFYARMASGMKRRPLCGHGSNPSVKP